ncbi:type II protein secretion system E protein [Helicobacter fennelliae]|nr:type II protein secretion system E protein [Helicobacter fennelliae]
MDFDNSAHDEILGVDLWSFCPHKALSDLLSFELASKLRAFVYSVDGQTLCIVMQNPFDEKAKQVLLHKFSHLCKKIIIAKESGSHFAWILQALQFVERFYISKDISQMLDFVLQEGIRFQASDIHIETKPDFASIRFRIDGYLREIGRIYLEDFTQLASKIKLESKLDITESRLPQDGRYNRNFNGIDYDFRISCVPLFGGESIVIRILYKHNKTITLQSLGINPHILEQLKIAIQKKNGLILITGPTGSGKSTTIYALLEELKSLQKKIITLEDPIEYQIKLAT